MIILDTNVLSELMRVNPAQEVVDWLNAQSATSLYVTCITLAEVFDGISSMPKGKRRTLVEAAARQVFAVDFAGRVLPFGTDAALAYAEITTSRRIKGRPISAFDAQIAAVVRVSGATLATRNTKDFEGCSIHLINPWSVNR